jgi:hypothetical protein
MQKRALGATTQSPHDGFVQGLRANAAESQWHHEHDAQQVRGKAEVVVGGALHAAGPG